MRAVEVILMFVCWCSFIWAAPQTPVIFVDMKQYLYRNEYRLVDFEVSYLREVTGDDYFASAIGSVEGKPEEMGVGHFFIDGPILPASAEQRFAPGSRVPVYYNPKLSNYTTDSRTARFASPERYKRLTFVVQGRMLLFAYGPLLFSLLCWSVVRRHNKVSKASVITAASH